MFKEKNLINPKKNGQILTKNAATAAKFKESEKKMENIKYKNHETVTCELCGTNAEIMDDGVIGRCHNCGYQWGDWRKYSKKKNEDHDTDFSTDLLTFMQGVMDTNIAFKSISKKEFIDAINLFIFLDKSCITPEHEINIGELNGKPSEIKSQFFSCNLNSIEFFARIDLWCFESQPSTHKIKTSLAVRKIDDPKIKPFGPIIEVQLMEAADIAWNNRLTLIMMQDMLTQL